MEMVVSWRVSMRVVRNRVVLVLVIVGHLGRWYLVWEIGVHE